MVFSIAIKHNMLTFVHDSYQQHVIYELLNDIDLMKILNIFETRTV